LINNLYFVIINKNVHGGLDYDISLSGFN